MSKSIQVSKTAIDFRLTAWTGINFKEISLNEYKEKYLILKFCPNNFTDEARQDLIEFEKNYETLKKLNCEVLFCNTDSKYSNKAFYGKNTKFPILSDLNHDIVKSYQSYNENTGHCYDSLFLINPEGVVKYMQISTISNIKTSIEEVVRLLQAYQFSNKYSVVCQSNWKQGKKGINPTYKDPRLQRYWVEELLKIPYESYEETNQNNMTENSRQSQN